jgi:uncharacterized protein YndB with AHSA1/START domain
VFYDEPTVFNTLLARFVEECGRVKRVPMDYSSFTKESHMEKNLIATASITINATSDKVWNALVTPAAIKQYMFGTTVVTDWREQSPIVWKGDWKGKPYEDKGVILKFTPKRLLKYSHFSPLAGLPDTPENYHTVTVELSGDGPPTQVALTQDKNATEEERENSKKNWNTMLGGLKTFVER